MPIHVNEVSTEITAAPSEGDAAAGAPAPEREERWRAVDRLRSARARLDAEEDRTRAEGFHA